MMMQVCRVGLVILDQRFLNRLNPTKRELSTKGLAILIIYRDSGFGEGNLHRRYVVTEGESVCALTRWIDVI
jgi:hypothetical protein